MKSGMIERNEETAILAFGEQIRHNAALKRLSDLHFWAITQAESTDPVADHILGNYPGLLSRNDVNELESFIAECIRRAPELRVHWEPRAPFFYAATGEGGVAGQPSTEVVEAHLLDMRPTLQRYAS